MTKVKKIIAGFFLPFILTGCVTGSRQNNDAPSIVNAVEHVKRDIKDDMKDHVASKVSESQNAIQANVSSLIGGSIAKMGEEVTGLKLNLKDLVHLQAEMKTELKSDIGMIKTEFKSEIGQIRTEVSNNIQLLNQIKLEVRNEMKAEFDSRIQAMATANAELRAKLEAEVEARVQGQVGWNNKINEVKNEMKTDAGRDVIQFNENMLAALRSANHLTFWMGFLFSAIVICIALAFVYWIDKIYNASRERADKRSEEVNEKNKVLMKVATKAIAKLEPNVAEGIASEIKD